MLRPVSMILIFLIVVPTSGLTEGFFLPDYHAESDFLRSTPSVAGDGIGAYFNPAAWGMVEGPEMQFIWDDQPIGVPDSTTSSRVFTVSSGRIFFALKNIDYPGPRNAVRKSLTDYQIGIIMGDKGRCLGFA